MQELVPLIEMPKSAEAPELMRQAARLFLTEVGQLIRPGRDTVEKHLACMDNSTGILAVDGGEVLALGRFSIRNPAEPTVGDLRALAVDPDLQGLGLGGDVLDLLESTAKAAGAEQMTVYSLSDAQGFYRKRGYKLRGELEFAKTL